MAISWGAWDYSGGNGMRVGLDISTSSVATDSTTVTFTVKVYTENQYNYSDPQTITCSGSIGGSTSFTNSSTTGQQVLRATKTYKYRYSTWGSSPGSRTFTARLSGAYNGVTPYRTLSVAIPTRPYGKPAAPTGLKAKRSTSGTSIALSWTPHKTTARYYHQQIIQMQSYTAGVWGSWTAYQTLSGSPSAYTAKVGISASVPYRFRIKSSNSAGDSGWTVGGAVNPNSTKPKPSNPPGASVIKAENICAPWDASVANLVKQTHAQRVSLVATTGYADEFDVIDTLDVVGGTITWDESSIPRVVASITTPALDADTLAALDPRVRPRVQVSVGYRMPSGVWDDELVADLQVRELDAARPDNTVQLTLTSDEVYCQEQPLADSPDLTDLTVDAATYLVSTIQGMFPSGDVPTVNVYAISKTVTYPASNGDRWANVIDICDTLDADIYDNGDRTFNITPRQYTTSVSRARFSTGANGNVESFDSGVTRDDWANAVNILYTPQNQTDPPIYRVGTARVLAGDYDVDTVGYRRVVENRTGYPSQAQANSAARALLRRYLGRARTLSLQAPAMWWLRPGDTITVVLPDYPGETRLLVSSVAFDLSALSMTLTTRAPDWASAAQIGD